MTYNHLFLLKIKFEYSFHYGGKRQIDTSICQVLQSNCKLLLNFKKGDYGVERFEAEFMSMRGLEEFQKNCPLINFNISSENISKQSYSSVIFINDPANQLIYGFGCSVGGSPPAGYGIFARLFHYKHFDIIEKLLYSPNPVTRLYACNALEHAYKKNLYVLPLKVSERINEIKNEETKIECCWGCSYEIIPIKEAVVKAESEQKHLYDTFIFFRDERE